MSNQHPIPPATLTLPGAPPPPQGIQISAAQQIRAWAAFIAVAAFAPFDGPDDEGHTRGLAIAEMASAVEEYIRDGHSTDVTNG